MAKKTEHYQEAERLYVQERCTYEQISDRLGVSERTLRTWGTEGSWIERRDSFTEVHGKTHEKLYKLIQTLTDKAIQSAEEGEEPSQSQLYFIAKMAPLLLKLQNYEETAAPTKPGEAEKQAAVQRYETVMEEMTKTLQQLGLAR
jgi:hypothetical protein